MPLIGQSIRCTITQTGSWGAYAVTEEGVSVFISLGELSWSRLRDAADVVFPRDVVHPIILAEPRPDRPHYLGSLKRTTDNPFANPAYAVGSQHSATVIRVGKGVVFLQLAEEVIAAARIDSLPRELVGELVQVEVLEIDPESQRILVELIRTNS